MVRRNAGRAWARGGAAADDRKTRLLGAGEEVLTMEWQPIETAPKDKLLLGYAEGMMRLVMWENGGWLQVGATIEQGWFKPTHWMPLPDPPKQRLTAP